MVSPTIDAPSRESTSLWNAASGEVAKGTLVPLPNQSGSIMEGSAANCAAGGLMGFSSIANHSDTAMPSAINTSMSRNSKSWNLCGGGVGSVMAFIRNDVDVNGLQVGKYGGLCSEPLDRGEYLNGSW